MWEQTEDQVFLEEEQEKRLEEIFDEGAQTGATSLISLLLSCCLHAALQLAFRGFASWPLSLSACLSAPLAAAYIHMLPPLC
jgi:hypothetical protein